MAGAESTFELFVGPLLVLLSLALMLFGVFSAQCYYYWYTYDKDLLRLRLYVLALWIFEAMHTSFCLHMLYFYFVTHYGDPAGGVLHVVWSAGLTVILEMAILCMTEGFYIHRIYRLSGSAIVAAIPTVFLIARVCLSLVAAGYLYKYDSWASFRAHSIPETCLTVSLSLAVATDLSITLLLVWYLRARKTNFSRTNHIIVVLMQNTINNGALAMILSVVIVVTLHALPASLMFAGLIEIISKLYANSMMASLNARQSLAQTTASRHGTSGLNTMELSVRQDTHVHLTRERVFTSSSEMNNDHKDQLGHIALSSPIKVHTETFAV